MAVLIIAIVVLLGLAAVVVLATGRQRITTGRLSRETRARDERSHEASPGTEVARPGDDDPAQRFTEARESIDGVPAQRSAGELTKPEPIDEEELGITRRQFFNRGILTGIGISVGAFGAAALGFLWPTGAGGFGGRITVGNLSQAEDAFAAREPFYNAAARTYVVRYPEDSLPNAEAVYDEQPPVLEGMEQGYVALFQRCPHLGCRVPWCQTSQWFECPCHGSKYNRVGEWRDGPAPRGMDRFGVDIEGESIVVDTSIEWLGPPKGTNTTGQSPEGSPCV